MTHVQPEHARSRTQTLVAQNHATNRYGVRHLPEPGMSLDLIGAGAYRYRGVCSEYESLVISVAVPLFG